MAGPSIGSLLRKVKLPTIHTKKGPSIGPGGVVGTLSKVGGVGINSSTPKISVPGKEVNIGGVIANIPSTSIGGNSGGIGGLLNKVKLPTAHTKFGAIGPGGFISKFPGALGIQSKIDGNGIKAILPSRNINIGGLDFTTPGINETISFKSIFGKQNGGANLTKNKPVSKSFNGGANLTKNKPVSKSFNGGANLTKNKPVSKSFPENINTKTRKVRTDGTPLGGATFGKANPKGLTNTKNVSAPLGRRSGGTDISPTFDQGRDITKGTTTKGKPTGAVLRQFQGVSASGKTSDFRPQNLTGTQNKKQITTSGEAVIKFTDSYKNNIKPTQLKSENKNIGKDETKRVTTKNKPISKNLDVKPADTEDINYGKGGVKDNINLGATTKGKPILNVFGKANPKGLTDTKNVSAPLGRRSGGIDISPTFDQGRDITKGTTTKGKPTGAALRQFQGVSASGKTSDFRPQNLKGTQNQKQVTTSGEAVIKFTDEFTNNITPSQLRSENKNIGKDETKRVTTKNKPIDKDFGEVDPGALGLTGATTIGQIQTTNQEPIVKDFGDADPVTVKKESNDARQGNLGKFGWNSNPAGLSNILRKGFVRKSDYEFIIFDNPTSTEEQKNISFNCASVTFGGKNIATYEHNYYGPIRKLPYREAYTDIVCSFYCSVDMSEYKYFKKWQNSTVSNTTHHVQYPAEYNKQVKINVFNRKEQITYSMTIERVFPVTVNDMSFSYADGGAVQTIDVTFTFFGLTEEFPGNPKSRYESPKLI